MSRRGGLGRSRAATAGLSRSLGALLDRQAQDVRDRLEGVEVVTADVGCRQRVRVVQPVLEVVAEGLPVVDQAVVVLVELVARVRREGGLDPVGDGIQ